MASGGKKAGKGSVVEELEAYLESDTGPIGFALTWAKEQTGQSKLLIYSATLAVLVSMVAVWDYDSAAALTLTLVTPYPIIQSCRVAELGDREEQAGWLLYWALHSLVFATVPLPLLRLLPLLWLQHPVTNGAALLYKAALRPFVLLQHHRLHPAAFADLHPVLAPLLGLNADVRAFLASPASAARLEPALKELAASPAGVALAGGPVLLAANEAEPKPHPAPASPFVDSTRYSNIASVAFSAITNAAAAKA